MNLVGRHICCSLDANKHLQCCYRNEKMKHLRVLSLLVCMTGVLLILFSPGKICFSSRDSYPVFINNRSWSEIGNETSIYLSLWVNSPKKVCAASYRHRVCYVCCCFYVQTSNLYQGDIESLHITHKEILPYLHAEASSYFIKREGLTHKT